MIKEKLKKIKCINVIKDFIKSKEFSRDKKIFLNNYMYSKNKNQNKIKYELLLEIHKLEKGMSCKNLRPFGKDKIIKIINLLDKYFELEEKSCFETDLSYSILSEYKKIYEENKWTSLPEYENVKEYLYEKKYNYIPTGAKTIKTKDIVSKYSIDYNSFLDSRKSIRSFKNKNITHEDIEYAIKGAILSPSACNRQMCKIYYVKNNKDVVKKYAQGIGLFELDNVNYFIITFDLNANYFIGERNQGWFNSGLFTMNFVNSLHSRGIGSCCVQFGNSLKDENEMKRIFNIPMNERIAVIVCAGYYEDEFKVPYSVRKDIEDIYIEI